MQRRWLYAERLEDRAMLSANPFHNGFWPEDVNNDLKVNALDAVILINSLNRNGNTDLSAAPESLPAQADVPHYVDVSGDGALSAVDVLRVINTVNRGEGEIAPSDVVRFRLELTDPSGNPLPGNQINVGQTFQIRAHVQDARLQGGSTSFGNPTGVFAAYMDVLMTNANLTDLRYGETQELRMDALHPGDAWGTGTIRLGFNGQQTTAIDYFASPREDALAIKNALEALPNIGVGNVDVTVMQGSDFDGRYFIRFKGALGERDVPALTVQGTDLFGSYQDVNDENGNGDRTEFLDFVPQPVIVDNYIPVDPATPSQEAALFRSSFTFYDPYENGPAAVDEGPELGQPAGSRQLGEVGAFLNRFSLNSPPQYSARKEYLLFSVDVRAVGAGTVQISGNPADRSQTLVFSLPGGGENRTEVDPANIGFIDPAPLMIVAPITVVNDARTTLEDTPITIDVLANDSVNPSAGGVAPLTLVAGGLGAVSPVGAGTVSIEAGKVRFVPAQDFNGRATFTYQARDARTPTPNTGTGTVTVDVTPVNDPPTLAAIPNLTINEDAGEQTVHLSGISAGGGESQPLEVTFTNSNSILLPDVTVDYTSPNATGQLRFTPAPNQNGTATIVVTVTDGGLDGNLATAGDNASVSRTFTVTVAAVNDAPVNTVPGPQTVANNAPFVFSAANGNQLSTRDPDGNVNIVTTLSVGAGTLSVKQGGGATITTPDATTVRIAGTVSQVNDALSVVTYNAPPQATPGFVGEVTLTMLTDDQGNVGAGGALTDNSTVVLSVVPPRQPFAANDSATVAEDSSDNEIDVLNNDIPSMDGSITITQLNGTDVAPGDTVATAHGTVSTDGTLVYYTPAPDYFGADSFTYQITAIPAGDGPHTGAVAITVTPVNDAPELTIPFTSLTTNEDTAVAVNDGANTIQVSDVDADAGGGLRVTITAGHGTLAAPSGSVTLDGAGTAALKITGLVAAVNAALAGLVYTPAADYFGADQLTVVVDDLGHTGSGGALTGQGTVALTIMAVNDAPTIKAPAQAATMQDQNLVFQAGTANEVSVADVDSPELTVTLTLADPGNTPGVLSAGAAAGVTITGNHTVALTLQGPIAGLNAALQALTYVPTAGYEGLPTLTITATDGDAAAPNATVQVVVSGINDPPVNILPAGPVAVAEDTDLVFHGNLRVTDPDAGMSPVEVVLTATHGTLHPVVNPNVVATGAGSGSVTLVGPITSINAALDGLIYRPAADYNGPAQLVIHTDDRGATGTGGPQTDTDTLAITVTPVNDPPVANDDGSPSDRFMVLWNSADNPFDVLANDNTGPDVGETLRIVQATATSGTVVIHGDQLLYTPLVGFTGEVEIEYTISDRPDESGLTDSAKVYLVVVDFVPSDISGYVYLDANDNGVKDPTELGVGGVRVTLTGTDVQGNAVNLTAWTDSTGRYQFARVMPSQEGTRYVLREHQPAALIDGKDTVGDQGGTLVANDQISIVLPLFGLGDGIYGTGNNFGEIGFRADLVAPLGLYDLVHSNRTGNGLLFGSDALGNVTWFINAGGWEGYVPGRETSPGSHNFDSSVQGGKLSLTDTRIGMIRQIDANNDAIRSVFRAGSWVTRISGEADDFGLPMYLAAAGGEGESAWDSADETLLAADGSAYEAAVDQVLAELA